MTGGGEGSAVTRPALAPVFASDGLATDGLVSNGAIAETKPRAGPAPDAVRLTGKLRAYDPKANTGLVEAAYTLALQAHGGQLRDNGDPYSTPSVAVADILAGYRLDTASIATSSCSPTVPSRRRTSASSCWRSAATFASCW